MLNPQVSIIVPIYDASEYLRPCLDSLIGQRLEALEIILINDCSPDPMDEKICLEYKAKDPRIVYIRHETNQGPGGARSTGLHRASAPYIGFVDSDDLVHEDMFQNCLAALKTDDYDFVQCNYKEISLLGAIQDKIVQPEIPTALQRSDLLKALVGKALVGNESLIFKGLWNKLWKKSIFIENNFIFPKNNGYEDMFITYLYSTYCHRVMLLPDVYYFYRQRENSITGNIKAKNVHDYIYILKLIRKSFSARVNELGEFDYANEIYRSGLAYCANMAYNKREAEQALLNEMQNDLLLQHLNYSQLRFVLNYIATPSEKRLWQTWVLFNELMTKLGVRPKQMQAFEKLAVKLNAFRKRKKMS